MPGAPFINVQSNNNYWSSTEYAVNPSVAWYVYVFNGYVSSTNKGFDCYVWAVRPHRR